MSTTIIIDDTLLASAKLATGLLESATHPQTMVVLGKDGSPLSAAYGARSSTSAITGR